MTQHGKRWKGNDVGEGLSDNGEDGTQASGVGGSRVVMLVVISIKLVMRMELDKLETSPGKMVD